jgi:SAM-dependent methyltransferase
MMAISIKEAIKPLLPRPVLEQWKRLRFNAEQAAARNRPLDHVFNEIYAKGMWRPKGSEAEFHSGPGSLAPVTAGYEAFVAEVIERDPAIETLVDIGCGDFQVSQRILERVKRPVTYVGCDIASIVVEHNQRVHGRAGAVSFQTLNVAKDPLPAGDIVTIREVFQHLSNDTILAALANLRRSFKRAIITEALPLEPSAPNLDIVSGYRTRDGYHSGVYLELAPFNLKVLDRYEVPAQGSKKNEVLRTLVVQL